MRGQQSGGKTKGETGGWEVKNKGEEEGEWRVESADDGWLVELS